MVILHVGHSFCNQLQADKGYSITPYNIAGLISNVSEEVAQVRRRRSRVWTALRP